MDITIYVGEQLEGCTFQLAPRSKQALLDNQEAPLPARSIYIAREAQGSFEEVYAPMMPQIVSLLTGHQSSSLGAITFVEPVEDHVLLCVKGEDQPRSGHG